MPVCEASKHKRVMRKSSGKVKSCLLAISITCRIKLSIGTNVNPNKAGLFKGSFF